MKKNIYSIYFTLILMCGLELHGQSIVTGKQSEYSDFLPNGKFEIGTNYWASHAGPAMWSDWSSDVVEKDLKKLSEAGIKLLRVFPLWPDFQPLRLLITNGGIPVEYRIGEESLGDDIMGKAGISEVAVNHFEEFINIAEKYDIKLIVGLLTGHMSLRNFVPEPFKQMDLISNTEAIKWEVRFIKYFVSKFQDRTPIVAWELGNECCFLAINASESDAWVWTSQITNAIKAIDPKRPVISGMPAFNPVDRPFNMQDLAELTDIATVHFYHTFVSYAEHEPYNTIRPILGPVVLNVETEGIGGKPCFIEEFGMLGPSFGDDGPNGVKPGFLRSNLFSAWAHNCRGLLWWIAFDQGHLTKTPFDWNSRGSEYGLWYPDGTAKPVLHEIQKFNVFLSEFEYPTLPERIIDGVCILTKGQDTWATAYSTFILAKQAGLDIDYQYCNQPIKDADLYFLPGVNGGSAITLHRMRELLKKVEEGSTLYISNEDGHIGPNFAEVTGVRIQSYTKRTHNDIVTINGTNVQFNVQTNKKNILETESAIILAVDQDENPAFTCNSYGKGKIYYLNYPLEKYLANTPDVFNGESDMQYWEIYNQMKKSMPSLKIFTNNNKKVGFTEHIVDNNTRLIIAINYFPSDEVVNIELKEGWKISKTLYGKTIQDKIELLPNDASVFCIKKK